MLREFCPNCQNEDVDWNGGMLICEDCGFSGNVLPERAMLDIGSDTDNEIVEVKMVRAKKGKKEMKTREKKSLSKNMKRRKRR